MNRQTVKWVSMMLAALLILPLVALAGSGENGRWRVNVYHDLNGGQWPEGRALLPHAMEADAGQSMADAELEGERSTVPVKGGHAFRGWSVQFTNPLDGTVIFDSGNEAWDLGHPFDYYPDNPRTMNCLMTALWGAMPPQSGVWRVNVSHDLKGGSWPDTMVIPPYQLKAKIGESMPAHGLDAEKMIRPFRAESVFLGWSVLFTSAQDGTVIYDSGDLAWDLNHPFDYYPDNPLTMNCLMTALWQSAESGGGPDLPQEILPDGRVLTRPFVIGTEPLPEVPPPCDQIIPGTTWLTNALICGIDEGTKVPVYSFPVYNGPVIDWVGLDDDVEYGLFLPDDWAMLYHPRWVEAGGIGFITSDAVDFPGSEE